MSEEWDLYFLQIDDRPASIYLDLGLGHQAPIERHETMTLLSLLLRLPREDGLSSQDEYDSLMELEDHIIPELTRSENAIFVGRITTDGRRDFVFYVVDEAELETRANVAMRKFPDYRYRMEARSDPEWKFFLEFMYPSAADMQVIMNRQVCENLKESGDDLTKARNIDHFAFLPSIEARSRYVAYLERNRFSIASLPQEPEEDRGYVVAFMRMDKPADIDGIVIPLYEKAVELGGEYDGWGCPTAA